MLFDSYSALSIDSNPILANARHSRHSRKQTLEITYTSKPQNIPSDMMWISPCYLIHILLCPLIPIQFWKNSRHSTDTAKPQNFPSNILLSFILTVSCGLSTAPEIVQIL